MAKAMSSATERLAAQMGGRIGALVRAGKVERGPELPPPGGEEGNGSLFIVDGPDGLRLCEVAGGSWFEIGFAAEWLTRAQANRIGRGRVRVIDDPDAPGNWWVYDARNPYRGESHAPMNREALAALVKKW